ncbi:MAG: hypothetical protein KF795_03020 [Labilithrix sp.]|nr:hypothetical protein [Labilithrix sp.]
MRFLPRSALVAPWLLAGTLAACGGGATPASAVRPATPTASGALGEDGCAADGAAPLVVDWPAHRRAELEATLRKGGAVLAAYDCKQLRVLTDCRAEGFYRYEPVSLKEELVRMNDADSVRARLPTMGASLAIALEGSLARGSSLDLGLAMAGRWTSSTSVVYGEDLSPECRAATHFVRTVPTGAFAMSVGSRANVRAVAEVFDAGARAESESAYLRDTRDGDLTACRAPAGPSGPAPGCSAPLRIELRRIDPRSEARAKCETFGKVEDCVWWSNKVFDREIDDREAPAVVAKLVALCRAGERGACAHAHRGATLFERARKRSLGVDLHALEERACELGEETDCLRVAERLETEGRADEAFRMREHACASRVVGCAELADRVEAGKGPTDAAERRQYLADLRARACQTQTTSCTEYAALYRAGLRARGDFSQMKRIVAMCEDDAKKGGSFGCAIAAAGCALGIGVPRDLARARQLYAHHCANPMVQNHLRGTTCELPKEWR